MTEMAPLTDAKTRLSALVDDVAATHSRVAISRHGMNSDEFEETISWLCASGAGERIIEAEADFADQNVVSTSDMLAMHNRLN